MPNYVVHLFACIVLRQEAVLAPAVWGQWGPRISETRNAWQSLAYSPLGAAVSPLAGSSET